MARKLIEDSISKFFLAFDAVEKEELSYAELPHQQNNFSGEHGLEAIQLKIDQDGSPVTLEPGI